MQGLPVSEPVLGVAVGARMPGKAMNAMMHVIPRSGSRKVNGYVKAVLALGAVRRKREDRYARVVRPLDRRRDELAAEVAGRPPTPPTLATRPGAAGAVLVTA